MKVKVTVSAEIKPEGGSDIFIELPTGQKKLSTPEMAHVLAAGIALLVKACNEEEGGVRDFELQKEIIDHLNTSFADYKSFKNIMIKDYDNEPD